MKHTPAPWRVHRTQDLIAIFDSEGKQIASLSFSRLFEQRDFNAQRIVDCVNALDGIELPTNGILSKENAHIYIGRQVAVYSSITLRWRHGKLNAFTYSEFMRGSRDFAKLSVITHNQIPVRYGK